MTVIAYSSAAGRIQKKMQVLEGPTSSGNVPGPLLESLEPRTMLDHYESQIHGVKGQRWIKEKKDQKTKEGVAGGHLERKRQICGEGVSKERVTTGEREKLWSLWKMKIRNYPKGSGKNRGKEKDQSKTDVLEILSAAETKGEIKQWEKRTRKRKHLSTFSCLFLLINVTKEGRNMGMRWRQSFLWIALLFLSLSVNPASSQVRVAFKSHFLFLIQRLWKSDC